MDLLILLGVFDRNNRNSGGNNDFSLLGLLISIALFIIIGGIFAISSIFESQRCLNIALIVFMEVVGVTALLLTTKKITDWLYD